MPLNTIMITANMVSRASVETCGPVSMTAAIIITSIAVMAKVRISVPNGSPRISASASACRTTANADQRITPKSHTNTNAAHHGFSRRSSSNRNAPAVT
jgi:hypothetical protein